MIYPAACLPQAFLRSGGTLTDLSLRFAIKAKRHGRYPSLIQLKYDQLESPMDVPLVQECRGLILDEDDDWRIVAWPFKKFFNHGEQHAARIDWRTARVQEKLDGSLMIMYYYDSAWQVATSGTPDAAGHVHGTSMTFAGLFWETWYNTMQFILPPGINAGLTFMFELTSPFNRVVVPHQAPSLTLIGARHLWSGKELPIRFREALNPAKEFPLTSIASIVDSFERFDPLTQEGYVVVDDQYNRIKMKHPGYVALHHLKSSFSIKRLVDVVRAGEAAEVLVHFPEWRTSFEQVTAAYNGLVVQLEQDWAELEHVKGCRKDFAVLALQSIWPAAHFMLLDERVKTVQEALRTVHIEKMVDLLGVKSLVLEGAIQ